MRMATPLLADQLAQHAPERALPVDHAVAGHRPQPFEQIVQPRVVERPRQHGDRRRVERVRDRLHLPVAEVAGEEEDAAPLLVRVDHALEALHLDQAAPSPRARGVPNFSSSKSRPPKWANMALARARRSAGPARRKRVREVLERDAAVEAVHPEHQPAKAVAARRAPPPSAAARRTAATARTSAASTWNRAAFTWPSALRPRPRAVNHSRNSAAGSMDARIGT